MTTRAPKDCSSRIFSSLILSGMTKTHLYPLIAAPIANPTPVLPEVASTMVPPGRRSPRRSASSMIAIPMRSLTEPPGFKNSAFARTVAFMPRVTEFSWIRGVLPMVARMLLQMSGWTGSPAGLVGVLVFVLVFVFVFVFVFNDVIGFQSMIGPALREVNEGDQRVSLCAADYYAPPPGRGVVKPRSA